MSFSKSDSMNWFNKQAQSFPFGCLSKEELLEISSLSQSALDSYQGFLERRKTSNIGLFDDSCRALNSMLKKISLENNIGKIAELDCHLVGLTSYLELCFQSMRKLNQQGTLNNFSKQIDCLKEIKRHCEYHKTYESYLPVIYDAVPGIDRNFSLGLPLDGVHRSVNSCVASIRNLNFGNYISQDYVDLLKTRELALKRVKALHSQQQIAYMDRYAREFPLDSQSEAFLDKREALIKSVDSVLAKTALELSENKSKSQENSQQAQDPASNKKTKSSPDLER